MELDMRILSGKRPLTALDTDVAKEFIGKQCYFADNIEDFSNLDNTNVLKGFLTDIDDNEMISGCFKSNGIRSSFFGHFIVPCEWTREKPLEFKWRAYTIAEFQETFTVGRAVRFRRKDTPNKEHLLIFGGYYTLRDGRVSILFGIHLYTLEELFEQYEWQEFYTDEYRPFGIKE